MTEPTRPAYVFSHERSGTHFLMNMLETEFGFSSWPPIDIDPFVQGKNYFSRKRITDMIESSRDEKVERLRKSHHQAAFFKGNMRRLVLRADVFYICRDPRDVTHSYRHFIQDMPWHEGPEHETAGAFIRAAPEGGMTRYQYHAVPNILQRWRQHVEGWMAAASQYRGITPVRYELLRDDYDTVVDAIAKAKRWTRRRGPRPEVDRQTVTKSKRDDPSNRYSPEDIAFFRSEIGETMRKLGYEI